MAALKWYMQVLSKQVEKMEVLSKYLVIKALPAPNYPLEDWLGRS